MVLSIEAATEGEIEAFCREHPAWRRDGNALVRVESFVRYLEALDFIRHVGHLAEEHNHHPDLFLHYRKATVRYWTHKIGGISRGDIAMADKVEYLRRTLPFESAPPPAEAPPEPPHGLGRS